MVTYKQLVYLILDELKLSSDDAYFNEEHILFLLDKYRAKVLNEKYAQQGMASANESNFQEICLNLEVENNTSEGAFCGCNNYLRSKETIPTMLSSFSPSVFTCDFYDTYIEYVSKERMRYVGNNRFLKNIIYCSLGPDNRLYFKSFNIQHKYLKKIKLKGIFESPELAAELSCNKNLEDDVMDREYPIEDELIPDLTAAILRDLLGYVYNPIDKKNNASDELPEEARGTVPQQQTYPRQYYRR